ncbi:calcium/proton exchanger [Microthyrium microscopicum]|uniref:Calcium/proton exchanger n=1 Tax=Microthyrium microscopicum TaxID=703497 RepID=A0A6A6UKS4_9PEZI|nr:calcium/proton exchanger [Microthyrium microscopicum]
MPSAPVNIGATRRQARREASKGNYNFWGGSDRPRRAQTDVERDVNDGGTEEAIHHAQTAPDSRTNTHDLSFSPTDLNKTTKAEDFAPVSNGEGSGAIRRNNGENRSTTDLEKNDLTAESPTSREEEYHDGKKDGRWKRLYRKMFLDDPIPVGQQLRHVLFPRWYTINWLLIAAPVGIGLNFTNVDPLAVFLINFIAIVPLAAMLSMATEEVALRVGEVLGGLLNASFGNAVELIVGVIALTKGEIIIVQTSLIGSMLSNLLLVLGMCFFFGGLNRVEQFFNETVAQTAASLLALAVGSLIIPTAYTWGNGFDPSKSNADEELSHGTSIILLIVYCAFLFFQLKTHRAQFNEPSQKVEKRRPPKDFRKSIAQMGGFAGAHSGGGVQNENRSVQKPEHDDEEEPNLTFMGALLTLCLATALIGVCSEFLVSSINGVTCKYPISQYFVGLILLPIVGNAAEHATAVTVAMRDKMDLAIGVAVGSSMQIALFVLPLMVVIGWGMGQDMTLVFDDFQIAVLFVAVILVNYLIGDGKSHWLEGVLLMALYIIIAVAAWFYPVAAATDCGSS